MLKIIIDKETATGKIKPMHCVNNYPSLGDGYGESFNALKIPYSRNHDAGWLNPHLVDIHAIFPDFDADETDEKSYDFAFTDFWVKRLNDLGVKTFYRLGESIENYQAIKPYYIYPPKDFDKWARICEHIILHYNFGWANGFNFGIEYWEIWNEPENYPDIADNQMWKGTFEEFERLYEITAKHLKNRFPDLKIGGYASCGFYAVLEQKAVKQAHSSSRTEYFVECAEKFLCHAKEKNVPLDFFSWHSYSGVKSNIAYAKFARELLDKYGFKDTESILNEWNPGIGLRGTLQDASNILANMLALQNEPLDMLMYYDLRINTTYNGLYDPVYNGLFKSYYVFKAFSELYAIGKQIKTSLDDENVYAVSAYNGKNGVCIITNNSEEEKELSISGIDLKEAYLLSKDRDLLKVDYLNNFKLKAFENIMIRFN